MAGAGRRRAGWGGRPSGLVSRVCGGADWVDCCHATNPPDQGQELLHLAHQRSLDKHRKKFAASRSAKSLRRS